MPSPRWIRVAAALLVLTAAAHTAGHFAPAPPPASATGEALAAMEAAPLQGMGLRGTPSVRSAFDALSLTMTVALAWLGLALWRLAARPDASQLVSQIRLALLGSGALVVVYAIADLGPPLACFVLVEIALALALLRGQRSA